MISKLIVNKFKGQIDFISKFKEGSTFFFTFEIEEGDQVAPITLKTTINIEHSIDPIVQDYKKESYIQTLMAFEIAF